MAEMNTVFEPAKTKRASEVIYEQIYQKIVAGELKAGDRLPAERILAEQFQRSRPSVREALRMLQQNGLVRIDIGSAGGAVIQGFSTEGLEQSLRTFAESGFISIQELTDYRIINDMGCARLAARNRTKEDIALLEENIKNYGNSINDPDSIHQIDEEFHYILANASHNTMVIAVNNTVTEMIVKFFWSKAREFPPRKMLHTNRAAYESHRALAEAVINGDASEAEKCIQVVNRVFYESIC